MKKTQRTSGFTLIELLISIMLAGMILVGAYSAFQGILRTQIRLSGTISIQRSLFYLNEKLASLIHQGGTLDYEEYFNRRMLGYDRGFLEKQSLYTFTDLSKYGNHTGTKYLCARDTSVDSDACLKQNATYSPPLIYASTAPFGITNSPHTLAGQLSYGQYRALGFNYASTLPVPTKLPAIFPNDATAQQGIPELYMIKKIPDGSYERTYFRHVFVHDPVIDTSKSCSPPNPQNCLGKIQITRLKSCDIVKSDGSMGSDGNIDIWIPVHDFSAKSTPITCATVDMNSDPVQDLLWIDLSTPDMHIIKAQFLPLPFKIPSLMPGTGETNAQSAMIQLRLEVGFSESLLRRGWLTKDANIPRVLITTFELNDV